MTSVAEVPLELKFPPPVDNHVTVWVTLVPCTVAVKPIVAGQAFRVILRLGALTETLVTTTPDGGESVGLGAVGDSKILVVLLFLQPETTISTRITRVAVRNRVMTQPFL